MPILNQKKILNQNVIKSSSCWWHAVSENAIYMDKRQAPQLCYRVIATVVQKIKWMKGTLLPENRVVWA